jgi:DNA adenine methylase
MRAHPLQYRLEPPTLAKEPAQRRKRGVLSWLGAKDWLAPVLVPRLLAALAARGNGAVYFEPFLGGASIFLALRAAGFTGRAVLSDTCEDLIKLYQLLRDGYADSIWRWISNLCIERDESGDKKLHFHAIRDEFRAGIKNEFKRAATMVFLSRLGFNGIWRVNQAGQCSTSFGGEERNLLLSYQDLTETAKAIQGAELHHASYKEVIFGAGARGVIYADPPYDACFVGYSGAFGWPEQERLEEDLRRETQAGAACFVSNSNNQQIRELYHLWRQEEVEVWSHAGQPKARKTRKELLLVSGAP